MAPPAPGEGMLAMKFALACFLTLVTHLNKTKLFCFSASFLWMVVTVGSKRKCAAWRLSGFPGA